MSSPQIRPQICPILEKPSSDEGNACGFPDSKAQRERFAEYSDFSTTNTTIRDEETGFGYFGARYYDSELLTGWLSVDPMSDKYSSINPYAYCAWNPMKLVDPDGREVLPTSEEAYLMILMTVPKSARDYIRCNKEGFIDRDLINLYDCESSNFKDLKELVNNDRVIEVSVSSSFDYVNKEGNTCTNNEFNLLELIVDEDFADPLGQTINGTSTGETGFGGVTQYPEMSASYPSTNQNIKVYVNSQLSTQGRAEVFAHEFYGHAYIYAKTLDVNAASHQSGKSMVETNTLLKDRIINAKRETINNNAR